jgi:hypothetical protein
MENCAKSTSFGTPSDSFAEKVDVIVVGTVVIGLAVARALSLYV